MKRTPIVSKVTKLFLLMILSFFLITACSSSGVQRSNISVEWTKTKSECRVVQHYLGEICIPANPQRIVTLDPSAILDPLIAIGFKDNIVGMFCYGYGINGCIAPGLSPDELEGIKDVGIGYQPSLEKIMMLKPDLILGLYEYTQDYKLLSEIAPTLLFKYDDIKLSFKNHFKKIAQLLDRKKIAEEILIQYQSRVAEVQKQLGDRLKDKQISVLIYTGGQFTTSASYAIYFQFLKDIGVKIKPIFQTQENYFPLSIETIDDYDADILFIANQDRKPASFFLNHPLISSLKAVKNGRIHIIESREVWDVFGPIGINRLLDRLSQYLLEDV
ncbi:ABC transporter substrate-binding protein [Phormidesmis sp. 146-12]